MACSEQERNEVSMEREQFATNNGADTIIRLHGVQVHPRASNMVASTGNSCDCHGERAEQSQSKEKRNVNAVVHQDKCENVPVVISNAFLTVSSSW